VSFLLEVVSELFGRCLDALLTIVKTEAAVAYVSCIVKVRRAFIAVLSLAFFILLAFAGFVLIHVALFAWLPWSLPAKALVLLILGAVYLAGGLAVAFSVSSDRTWMKFARIDRILADLGR
jgi:hypothetical protein